MSEAQKLVAVEKKFLLSVVVATYQGAQRINFTLNSLAQQTFTDFETIVVIDGSTDETEKIVEQNKKSLHHLRVVVQKNKGRAGARNAGASKASANAIVFFDDDIEIPPTTLALYFDVFKNGKDLIVGGLYPIQKDRNDFFYYADYLSKKWTSGVEELHSGKMSKPYITAGNFLIGKELFVKMGGFNEGLRDAEDFDLAVRLFELGVPLYFAPEISVGHLIQSDFKAYAKRLSQYEASQRELRIKNPDSEKYFTSPSEIAPFKKKLLNLFSFSFMLDAIDSGLFKILPRKIRFKIYDLILTAHILKSH
jgi:glycosyltransferase involved in cell wall biosynthesis